MSWALSVYLAKKQYSDLALVTDTHGAEILVNKMGLPFSDVSLSLDKLKENTKAFWGLGKIVAYAEQERPFIHLDSDIYLWKQLPAYVGQAGLTAQSPDILFEWYRQKEIMAFLQHKRGYIPEPFSWYFNKDKQMAYCCGIVGGNNLDFIQFYAKNILDILYKNYNLFLEVPESDKFFWWIAIEQYLLAACAEYYQDRLGNSLDCKCLFTNPGDPYQWELASELGFTHLISWNKEIDYILWRLEDRVKKDCPVYYERINSLF
jgi:hypothetical protein